MSPHDLGRRAGLLHIKLAYKAPTTSGTTAPAPASGAGQAGSFGAKPGNVGPATSPAIPNVPTVPAAANNAQATTPQAATARPATPSPATAAPAASAGGGGGIGSMLGGMLGGQMTAQNLGQIISNPALSGVMKPLMGTVGMPGLMGLSNLALGGGRDIGNIMKGNVGGVTAGT